MAVVYNKYAKGVTPLVTNANAATDQFGFALTNTVNATTDSTMTPGVYDLSTGAGYTAGGVTATTSLASTTGGIFTLVLAAANPTWTATGTLGPWQYVVLYDRTLSTNNLIGYWDYGASIIMFSGDTFTVVPDPVNGVIQVS